MDKNEFNEINDKPKELFWWDESANYLLMVLQRETSVIDGAIISRKFQDGIWSK